MSDATKSSKSSKSESKSESSSKSDSGSTSSSTESKSSSGGDGGKSAKESVGGASAVHYGYFSNVKSPEYLSGWDDIWGGKKKKKAPAKKRATKAKPKEPVTVEIDFDDLPEEAQAALADAARAQLKKSRVSYDNRDKAGAVSWRIDCEVKR